MDTLPFELASSIVENFNLRDAENAYIATTKDERTVNNGFINALKDRLSHQRYLRKLTAQPEKLLELMEKYTCILRGDCVLPYFFPNLGSTTGRWQIVCTQDNARNFMEESANIGMVWRSRSSPMRSYTQRQSLSCDSSIYIGFSRNFMGRYVTVEIIDTRDSTPLRSLMGIPTTISQCFIAGSFACHMYYSILEENTAILWNYNLKKYMSFSPVYNESCNSCKILRNVDSTRFLHEIIDILLTIRYTVCLEAHTREEYKEALLQFMSSNKYYTTLSKNVDICLEELIDAFTSKCICNYKDGTEIIYTLKNYNLKLELSGSHSDDNYRSITDDKSFVYEFDAVRNNALLNTTWIESLKSLRIMN